MHHGIFYKYPLTWKDSFHSGSVQYFIAVAFCVLVIFQVTFGGVLLRVLRDFVIDFWLVRWCLLIACLKDDTSLWVCSVKRFCLCFRSPGWNVSMLVLVLPAGLCWKCLMVNMVGIMMIMVMMVLVIMGITMTPEPLVRTRALLRLPIGSVPLAHCLAPASWHHHCHHHQDHHHRHNSLWSSAVKSPRRQSEPWPLLWENSASARSSPRLAALRKKPSREKY